MNANSSVNTQKTGSLQKRNLAALSTAITIVLSFFFTIAAVVAQELSFEEKYSLEQLQNQGYQLLYDYTFPDKPNLTTGAEYKIDNSGTITGLVEEVAYKIALDRNPASTSALAATSGYAFISMASFTNNLAHLGIPVRPNGVTFQQNVADLKYELDYTYRASDGKTTDYKISNSVAQGNIEFWPNNYNNEGNPANVPNASATLFDFGDKITTDGWHGSMQIHDFQNKQTLFAFNNWNGGNAASLGLGNSATPGAGNSDWTFIYNSPDYSTKNMQVFVKTFDLSKEAPQSVVDEISTKQQTMRYSVSAGIGAQTINALTGGSTGLPITKVGLYYSKPENGGTTSYVYASMDSPTLSGGKISDMITSTGLIATNAKNLTVTSNMAGITNITAQTTGNLNVAYGDSGVARVFTETGIAPMMNQVAGSSDYTLVQGAKIAPNYSVNLHGLSQSQLYNICDYSQTLKDQGIVFDRVGYYMEYAETADSPLTYVFCSFDTPTTDVTKIGIPVSSSGILYQQTVKNLEVTTNVKPVDGTLTDGAGNQLTAGQKYSFDQGYLEFWPTNYSHGKSSVISGGSGVTLDINDTRADNGGHGSMQIHNVATEETVFSLSGLGEGYKGFGIGTNPKATDTSDYNQPHPDWTFANKSPDANINKAGYQIANVYMYVHEADALLQTGDYSLFQRDANNEASVTLSGQWLTGAGKSIASIKAFVDGNPAGFDLTVNPDKSFSGNVTLSGGNHDIVYKAFDATGNALASCDGSIGVGEIFITAGQSNSTNCGDAPGHASSSGLAYSYNFETGKWQTCNDPQPIRINGQSDGSAKGSTWAPFCDQLSEDLGGIPVGVACVGWSGSAIQQWNPNEVDTSAADWDKNGYTPGAQTLFGRMAYALEQLDGDVAGILWHQGESNAGNYANIPSWTDENGNPVTLTYEDALNALIAASRDEAGNDELPWCVALVSANGNWTPSPGLIALQQAVIDGDELVFLGPDTDTLTGTDRGTVGNGGTIHFSVAGLEKAGKMWAEAVLKMLKSGDYSQDVSGSANWSDKKWMIGAGPANEDWSNDNKAEISLTSGSELTIDENVSAKSLGFSGLADGETAKLTAKLTESGTNVLTLTGGGNTLSVDAGTVESSVQFGANTNLVKTGAGTFVLTNSDALSSGMNKTEVNNGTLRFSGEPNTVFTVGDVTISGDGILELGAAEYDINNLIVAGNGQLLVSAANSTTIDLDNIIVSEELGFLNVADSWSGKSLELFSAIPQINGAAAPADFDWDTLLLSSIHDTFSLTADGGKLVLSRAQDVPEPATWALLALGVAGFAFWRKKERR